MEQLLRIRHRSELIWEDCSMRKVGCEGCAIVSGPNSENSPRYGIPVCKLLGMRALTAIKAPITLGNVESFGVSIGSLDPSVEAPVLTGFLADCVECEGTSEVGVDSEGCITSITPLQGVLSLGDACTVECGWVMMERFPASDEP